MAHETVQRTKSKAMRALQVATVTLRSIPARAKNDILLDSWGGLYNDAPRALYERMPDYQGWLWVAKDTQSRLPRSVFPDSSPHVRAQLQARAIITNRHLPNYYGKRSRTTVVQTWHGTPLKRIGFDLTAVNQSGQYNQYLGGLARDVDRWSCLVSPSPFYTDVVASAFHYDGPVIECGSPRNDRLVRSGPADRRRERRALGIGDDERVVLFAPTFRDDGQYDALRTGLTSLLNRLPSGWRAIMRAHPGSGLAPLWDSQWVIDGNSVEDPNDLMIAADVLVTDYSSLMFDYMLIGKPIIKFCPDLDRYRSQLRGFYLDYDSEVPGTIATTVDDVLDIMLSSDADIDYEKFIERFAPWDDGSAAPRLLTTLADDYGLFEEVADPAATSDLPPT